MKKLDDWVTWETFVLVFYVVGNVGILVGVDEWHDAFFWSWTDALFGLFWLHLPLIAVWSLAKKWFRPTMRAADPPSALVGSGENQESAGG